MRKSQKGKRAGAGNITVPQEAESQREAINSLLSLFATKSSRKEYLEAVVERIGLWSGCRCVGIRVLDESGNIPYDSYVGFSQEFWEEENFLTITKDKCICTRIISGLPEPEDAPYLTPVGSFRCDNTKEFISGISEEGRAKYRGTCLRVGFISLAVIPIRYREQIIGLIHLADEREGTVPLTVVEFIESMSPLIGEAMNRFNLEEELQRDYQIQTVISKLVTISLEKIPLEEILERAIDIVFSVEWIAFQGKGGISLVEAEPEVLVLKVQRGLAPQIQEVCARVPFGRCLCGRAALKREIEFADHVGELYETRYEGIIPHGHYCVPILSTGKVLGVLNLYLKEGHRRYEREEAFLQVVANTLAGVIERKLAEKELEKTLNKLQRAVKGSIQTAASMVEVRDPYTAGHQRRVTSLACAMAREMGLPKERIEALRMAGAIHDIGKIYIPAEILSKPGRITEIEFSVIKTHPQVT